MFYYFKRQFRKDYQLSKLTVNFGSLLFLLAGFIQQAQTASAFRIPPGFELITSAPGIELYRKNYPGGSPDFVQVIDLSQGARVIPLVGAISVASKGQGVYGGDNPRFIRKSIHQFWNELGSRAEGAFCVSNGQFFRLADSPTPLPFPLKIDGQVLTDGYGIKEFPGQKLILELWSDRADINELTPERLYQSDAPDIVAGLTEDASKASKKAVGRTFIGIADGDGYPGYEILMIFNTRTSKPKDAADTLRDFGASKVMMLDGGGSTQLICNDDVIIDTTRLIPQALGVASGEQQPYSAVLDSAPDWPVIVAGQAYRYSLTIRNTGSEGWQTRKVSIRLDDPSSNDGHTLALAEDVPAGGSTSVVIDLTPLEGVGVRSAHLALDVDGRSVPIRQGTVGWVVLPPSQMSRQVELLDKLAAINPVDAAQVQAVVDDVVGEMDKIAGTGGRPQASTGLENSGRRFIDLKDAVLVPVMMIPVLALLVLIVRELQSRRQ